METYVGTEPGGYFARTPCGWTKSRPMNLGISHLPSGAWRVGSSRRTVRGTSTLAMPSRGEAEIGALFVPGDLKCGFVSVLTRLLSETLFNMGVKYFRLFRSGYRLLCCGTGPSKAGGAWDSPFK